MANSPLPLVVDDLSRFARTLRKNWPVDPPGHAETLGLIAKAAGYRNHQALKAALEIIEPVPPATAQELKRLRDALRVFSAEGIMQRWPNKTSVQRLALAAVWMQLPARKSMTEPEVNVAIQSAAQFGDHVLIRRALIENHMITRARDGTDYRRVERKPTEIERGMIRAISERRFAAGL